MHTRERVQKLTADIGPCLETTLAKKVAFSSATLATYLRRAIVASDLKLCSEPRL
jgi:hypothetical protein